MPKYMLIAICKHLIVYLVPWSNSPKEKRKTTKLQYSVYRSLHSLRQLIKFLISVCYGKTTEFTNYKKQHLYMKISDVSFFPFSVFTFCSMKAVQVKPRFIILTDTI